ncbi:MAG: hypothetical protein DLM69_07755 [Candidatus Chloroheliales bacterium]|nr:MAG: hypothetical protein DLM69_07755 [Chloroflexota bacterium]
MSQPQSTKKGQSRTPVQAGAAATPPLKKAQPSGAAPKSQIKQAPTTRNASKWRAGVKPTSSGMSTPMLMGLVIGGILVVGIIAIAFIAPALSNSSSNNSANVPLGVEKTYPIANGVNNHKDGTINYAAIAPYVIPPVGGPHNPIWYNCGIYNQPIPTENAVHDLEHGAVWVTYQPGLDANALSTLQGIAHNYQKIIVSPYPGITAPIIASAWGGGGNTGYQIRINPGDWNTLQSFITKHSGAADAPEPGSSCTNGQGTPLP